MEDVCSNGITHVSSEVMCIHINLTVTLHSDREICNSIDYCITTLLSK